MSQLEVAMNYGLFSNYSYIINMLEKPPPIKQEEITIEIISEFEKFRELYSLKLGVSSSLFGGSFDVVQSGSESSPSSSSLSNSESGDSQEEASDE